MRQVQDALASVGIEAFPGAWKPTAEHTTAPDQYIVYTPMTYEAEHWDEEFRRYRVYVKSVVAYHEILVIHRVVDAHFAAFLKRFVLVAPYRVREARAERQMARRVFVEPRVVKQYA